MCRVLVVLVVLVALVLLARAGEPTAKVSHGTAAPRPAPHKPVVPAPYEAAKESEPVRVQEKAVPVPPPAHLSASTPLLRDLCCVVVASFVVQVLGFLWYGPLLSSAYVRLAFGSMAHFKAIEHDVAHGYHFGYRRALTGSLLGNVLLVMALRTLLNVLHATDEVSAVPAVALVSLLTLSNGLVHDLWTGGSLSLVLFDQTFNVLALTVAALALLRVPDYL